MQMAEYTKNERRGICPHCESNNLDYGIHPILDDTYIGFEWECNNCGTTGVEWYALEFIENIVNEEEN